jgi:tetratricopeptide (TPR) repeat protein
MNTQLAKHLHLPTASLPPQVRPSLLFALLIFAATLQLAGCNSGSSPSAESPDTSAAASVEPSRESAAAGPENPGLPAPTSPASEFLNTDPHTTYSGSQSCRNCHSEIADAFSRTSHSRALSSSPPTLAETTLEDPATGYVFRSQNDPQKLIHSAELQLINGNPQLFDIAWTVGSGHFGHSFLALVERFLVQSPLTWYSTRNCWDLSPGYSGPDHYAFHRTISARCLYCHAGNMEIQDHNEYFVEIHEQGISCERCHGPGELHVAKHENTTDSTTPAATPNTPATADLTIVNPARLSRQLAESVCEQCHLQGDAQIFVRGRKFDDYRPGLPLSSFRQEYRADVNGQMTIVGHVEQMHASACYKQSTTMTCVTCHHPHQKRSRVEQSAAYRNACLECHQSEQCREQQPSRQKLDDRCTDCHMPKSPTELPHVAFTHHRIGLHSAAPQEIAKPTTPERRPALSLLDLSTIPGPDGPDRQRNHGLALLQLTFKTGIPDGLRHAQELLQNAWDGGARDAAVAAGLARIAEEIGWNEKAQDWALRTLELETHPSDERCSALRIHSELLFNSGRYEQALAGFEELTQVRRDARHWFYRGMTEQNLNRTEAAINSLRTSLQIDPRNPGPHAALAAILGMQKRPAADPHHKAAQRLLQQSPKSPPQSQQSPSPAR